jgi:hypothetical protein
MTQRPDQDGSQHDPDGSREGTSEIIISGLDEPEAQTGDPTNISPTDKAVQLLQSHRARGEPEDEDG